MAVSKYDGVAPTIAILLVLVSAVAVLAALTGNGWPAAQFAALCWIAAILLGR